MLRGFRELISYGPGRGKKWPGPPIGELVFPSWPDLRKGVQVLLSLIPGQTESGFIYAKPQLQSTTTVPTNNPSTSEKDTNFIQGDWKKINSKSMPFKNRGVPDVT